MLVATMPVDDVEGLVEVDLDAAAVRLLDGHLGHETSRLGVGWLARHTAGGSSGGLADGGSRRGL